MTTADLVVGLARANLAASVAVLAVLALRAPARRLAGAHVAYALWLIPPAALAGALTPGWSDAFAAADDAGRVWLDGVGPGGTGRADTLAALWLAGFAATLALAFWRQARFAAAAHAGRAGPAVVGVIAPRLVAPADFTHRFSDAERRLIRAHELAHIDRRDNLTAALGVVATWLGWFNPLAHVALGAFRRDQELACDATVMARLPRERRAYAETLLSSEPAVRGATFVCHWQATDHPLTQRIAMLTRRTPSQLRRDLGLAAVLALCAASFAAAWAAQPPLPEGRGGDPAMFEMEVAQPTPSETARVFGSRPHFAAPSGRGEPPR